MTCGEGSEAGEAISKESGSEADTGPEKKKKEPAEDETEEVVEEFDEENAF